MIHRFDGDDSIMRLTTALLLALAFSSSACDPATPGRVDVGASNGFATPIERLQTQTELSPGTYRFSFSDWAGPDLPVWLHLPSAVDLRQAPIAVVMHGAGRDADRYMRQWVPHAESHGVIVVAPKFSKRVFPGALRYNLGHVFDEDGNVREEADWSFSAIEPLFDAVRTSVGNTNSEYAMYGHSGGSQFVHRYLYYKPNARASRYVLANAGWYTFPDFDIEYPYGLSDSGIDADALRRALAKDVIVLLGTEDNDPDHRSLRRTPEALAQGPHRFARGQRFFAAAAETAERNGWPFGWRLQVVEGVAHSNRGMAAAAIDLVP